MTFVWRKNDSSMILLAGPAILELRDGVGCVSTAPRPGVSTGAPLATIVCGVRGWAEVNWVEIVGIA